MKKKRQNSVFVWKCIKFLFKILKFPFKMFKKIFDAIGDFSD